MLWQLVAFVLYISFDLSLKRCIVEIHTPVCCYIYTNSSLPTNKIFESINSGASSKSGIKLMITCWHLIQTKEDSVCKYQEEDLKTRSRIAGLMHSFKCYFLHIEADSNCIDRYHWKTFK